MQVSASSFLFCSVVYGLGILIMAILVLGGAGYIGSHMVDRLIEKGEEEVVVVDSLVTGHRAAVHPAAKFYQGDLAD